MTAADPIRRAAWAATTAATMMIAQLIAGKALRDALFLSHFDVALLPPMIIGAALVSIVVALLTARLMARTGPGRLIPITFGLSALLFLIEWGVVQAAPQVIAIALYLHMAVFGAVLISGFWSLVNERFDPHTAKQKMGLIAGGATLGGLLGGLLAERVAALVGTEPMFPILAGMHLFCAWRVLALRAPSQAHTAEQDEAPPRSGLQALREMPHLRNLALLLVLTTVGTGLIDFVFKAYADGAFPGDGAGLMRFFAMFYTTVGLLAFLVQTSLVKRALERFGLASTVAALPVAVVAAGGFVFAWPGLVAATALRGVEDVARNSFYRSAYELFYTPVPRADKRATKLLIDVAFDRLSDAVAAAVVAGLLLAGPVVAYPAMVGLAIVLAVVALIIAPRLHRSYVRALEASLVDQAVALDLSDVRDSTTRLTLLDTLGALDVDVASALETAPTSDTATANAGSHPDRLDPVVVQISALRSGAAPRVLSVLRAQELRPEAVPSAIALLAWDEVCDAAVQALRRVAARATGQLVDTLLDPEEDFAIRRRVARVLRFASTDRAITGLLAGLADRRFEVRYQCGRALLALRTDSPTISFDKGAIYTIIDRELDVPATVWAGYRLLDHKASGTGLGDGLPRAQVSLGLEHVFDLLCLVLPPRPTRVAFRGLHTDDPALRGTALEYLESALPTEIGAKIQQVTPSAAAAARAAQAGDDDPIERLLRSGTSIELNLSQLHRNAPTDAEDGGEP